MNLDAFKLAAKRLRKQIAELNNSGAQLTLTQSHALDTLARVLGYRDFPEARVRLAGEATPNVPAQAGEQKPHVLGLAGPPGCGKTMQAKSIVAKAIAEGIPVRVLEHGKEYHEFATGLEAKVFRNAHEEGFFEAWRSDAPFVSVDLWTRKEAGALDLTKMVLPFNTLVVCDEATLFSGNFQPLGGICLLIGQRTTDFPVKPTVTFVWQNQRQWALQVPDHQPASAITGQLLRGLLAR